MFGEFATASKIVSINPIGGGKSIIIVDIGNEYIGAVFETLFLSSLTISGPTMIEVTTMGMRAPEYISAGPGDMTIELMGQPCELLRGKDLPEQFDPTNLKSNIELLKILDTRYTKEHYGKERQKEQEREGSCESPREGEEGQEGEEREEGQES